MGQPPPGYIGGNNSVLTNSNSDNVLITSLTNQGMQQTVAGFLAGGAQFSQTLSLRVSPDITSGNPNTSANSWFRFGIRAPGQTFGNCMQQHSQDYSIAGAIDLLAGSNLKENSVGAFLLGNHVSGPLFGSGGEAAITGVHLMPTAATLGMGSTLAFGRYAPNLALNLNKAGSAATSALGWNTNLAAKTALQGVEKVFNLGLTLEMRLGADIGFTLAEAAGCARTR